jgi:hypothetical protein
MLSGKAIARASLPFVVTSFFVVAASTANADLVSTITNGNFETYTADSAYRILDFTPDGWSKHDFSAGSAEALVWIYANMDWTNAGGYPYPAITGNGALGLSTNDGLPAGPQTSWVCQSLGTLASNDLGKQYTLSAQAGGRYGPVGQIADISIAFAVGADSLSVGTTLASGSTRVSSNGTSAIALSNFGASYTPKAGDVGHELFAVVSIAAVHTADGGQNQYVVDNVALSSSVVPEPRAMTLLATGLAALSCFAWRKRR